jgi:hypothetical protein
MVVQGVGHRACDTSRALTCCATNARTPAMKSMRMGDRTIIISSASNLHGTGME